MITIIGYILALITGLTLGIIGGGGSILTVPIFAYLLGIEPVMATAYSLFVVGVTALVGAFRYMQKGEVSYRTALVFAVPSFIAVFLTRRYIVPAIPDELIQIGDWILTKDIAIMALFGVILLLAAISMIRSGKKQDEEATEIRFNYPMIVLEGAGVGVLTGIVGAGGGFLIVPALVLLARLPMRLAVGTSLLIIAAKSLIGFLGDIGNQAAIDWPFLLIFTALSVAGIFLGTYLAGFFSSKALKKGFGWFVLLMGVVIVTKELILRFM